MNRRTVDLRDATRQDIIDICSAIEQIFLFYKQEKTPYIYIINLLELLLQSARTRVCVLRLPKDNKEQPFTLEEVKKEIVVFANFRDRQLYEIFCTQLVEALNQKTPHFLSYELVRIPAKQEDLYFCLPRISIKTNEVLIDHKANPEAYSRIRQLLQTMLTERNCWGTDLLNEMYQCLASIPHDSNLNCPDTCNTTTNTIRPQNILGISTLVQKNRPSKEDDLFSAIEDWVDYVYQHASESRLNSVPHHADDEKIIDYKNIFFFLRINKPNDNPDIKNCDNFDVKIIIPKKQRRELSLYYHREQKNNCQWYNNGKCGIHGMPHCEFDTHWRDLPPESKNWNDKKIFSAYEYIWQGLDDNKGASKRTSEDAFRNNSVIFERYARHKHPDIEKGYVRIDPKAKRDRLMACIRYRLLPTPDDKKPEEDSVPQVMFVPIYTGGAPFVLAATVVNAKRPQQQSVEISEWRKAYRFAGMVLQFMSSRLKEAARKAYLNAAADMMEDFSRIATNSANQDIIENSLHEANRCLATLALAYPYQKILLRKFSPSLENSDDLVNDKERQIIEVGMYKYEILLQENDFWCHYSADKTFFTTEDVEKKFKSAHGRVALMKQELLDEEVKRLYEERFGGKPLNSTE